MGSRTVIQALSVTSECVPLIKTGGLADVAGALPKALAPFDVNMRTLIPGYPVVIKALAQVNEIATLPDCFGGPARLLEGEAGGLDLLVLDAPHLFERGAGPYLDDQGRDWQDNPQRFAALSWVAAEIANGLIDWQPQIVQCHDWQAGFTPYYMRKNGAPAKSVLTIHNIAFQGAVGSEMMGTLRLDPADYHAEGLEYWGHLSALKAGLIYADHLTTVSPTYANELMTPDFGMGFDGLIRARRADFSGILNGIDEEVWSPATDPAITRYTTLKGKAANKAALRERFGLEQSDGPLCVVVSRLSEQKGFDMLLEALPSLTARGGQLVLLGSGDSWLESAFSALKSDHIGVHIGYDEQLSHQIIAGGDAILVPSRFEPCGLTQLYGLRYGTLPLVSLTGGLADTVIPASPATNAMNVATGVQFFPVTALSLTNAFDTLCDLYADKKRWQKMQRNAMRQPVGWDRSAAEYASVYTRLLAHT